MAPGVTALSAWHTATSEGPCGDGSALAVDFYILAIRRGPKNHGSYYLVKVSKDPAGQKPFLVACGGQITGSIDHLGDDDRRGEDKKRSRSKSDTNSGLTALMGSRRWMSGTGGCPPDVQFCISGGDLVVDLDKNNDGDACTIVGWVLRKGNSWKASAWIKGPYDPRPLDEDDPHQVLFLRPR